MAKSINKETRSTSIKKFIPDAAVNDGLVKGVLIAVEKREAEIKIDSNWEVFRGMKVPRLSFVFEEFDNDKDQEPCRYIHSFLAYPLDPSKSEKDDWQWNQLSQTLKHFIDVFTEDKFLDEYVPLLELDDTNTDVDAQIKAWDNFMDGVVTIFNGDGKKLPKLVGKKVWMKLLLTFKNNKVNNGDFGMPSYPGDGVVELYTDKKKPNLRINITKGESITVTPYKAPDAMADISNNASTGDMPSFMKK